MEEEVITIKELCKRLRVSEQTIHKEMNRKTIPLPFYKIRKSTRYLWSEILRWLRESQKDWL